jgi:hypothetical protein
MYPFGNDRGVDGLVASWHQVRRIFRRFLKNYRDKKGALLYQQRIEAMVTGEATGRNNSVS